MNFAEIAKNIMSGGFLGQAFLNKGLAIAKNHLEDVTGHEVKKFHAQFYLDEKKLQYTVWYPNDNWPVKYQGSEVCEPGTHLYIQDQKSSEKFFGALESFMSMSSEMKIPEGAVIKILLLDYDVKEVILYAFVEINGEKQTIKHKLK